MSESIQAEVIAACKTHENQNWRNADYRACVFVGAYFVKYGAAKDLMPELATQEYLFAYAQQPQTPRIAKIVLHFIDQHTMYLVMERIELQTFPPDLTKRIQETVEWLSNVPLPPNLSLGPVGSGVIRHKFFKDWEAPFNFSNTAMLDLYMRKAYGLLSKAAKKKVSLFSIDGERLMFAQSDMHDSNFGVDENGRTVLMDFGTVGVLPESLAAFSLSSGDKFDSIIASMGLSSKSKLASMAAIAHCLGMVADPKLDMETVFDTEGQKVRRVSCCPSYA